MAQYILKEIFPDFADFREAAPGVDSNLKFPDLNSTAISSKKIISEIITKEIWDEVATGSNQEALMYLRSAYANMVMYKHQIFLSVQNRLNDKGDTYKYEIEAMKRQYVDNYHNAMDSLLHILSQDASYNWSDTWYAKQTESLQIKDVFDFQNYYYIDTSFLYFIRTVPIQKKELLQTFQGYYNKIKDRQDLLPNVSFALVYTIIARSLQQFDLIEFPPTIRNYFDDNTLSRNGKDERSAMLNMADNFLGDASGILDNIDLTLQGDEDIDINSGNTDNREENKYYFMG